MSKVGSKSNMFGKQLNVVITNGTKKDLLKLINSNTQLDAKNSLIVSIKSDSEGNDIPGSASLWMTDSEGYLLQLTNPIIPYEEPTGEEPTGEEQPTGMTFPELNN